MLKSSDLANEYHYFYQNQQNEIGKIDNSFIELGLFNSIKLDIVNLVTTKASLSKNFHIQPSEIDKMPMWEYELYVQQLNELIKDENDHQKKEMDQYHINDYLQSAHPKNIQKMVQTPKMPDMPKMPSMDVKMPNL